MKRYASVLTHQKVQLVHLIKKRCSHHAAIKEEALNLVKAKLSRTHTTDLPFDAYNPDFFIIKVESSDLYVVPEHLPLYFFQSQFLHLIHAGMIFHSFSCAKQPFLGPN